MTEEMLRAVLDAAQAQTDKTDQEGWARLPEGRLMTIYAAHHGASLTVSKVERVRVAQTILRAATARGETFLLSMDDVFAAAVDGQGGSVSRKAGFMG